MKDFYKTRAGQKYFDHDLPKLIESNNRLAKAIEEQNAINEKANRLGKLKTKESSTK
jgi:hypothetical protein